MTEMGPEAAERELSLLVTRKFVGSTRRRGNKGRRMTWLFLAGRGLKVQVTVTNFPAIVEQYSLLLAVGAAI